MRPSKAVKVLKSARLEIEVGISVWVARRREKGRHRARMHRERIRRTKLIPPLNLSSPLRQQQPHERKAARRKFKTSEPHCCRPMANQGNFETKGSEEN